MRASQRARKTRAHAHIQKNLAKQQAEGRKTNPETRFNQYQTSRNFGFLWDRTIKVTDPETGDKFSLQIDFPHPNPKADQPGQSKYDYCVAIDGRRFHQKKTKEVWRDRLLNLYGLRVFHVPSEMADEQWYYKLDEWLPRVIASGGPVEYIDKVASGLI